jgi:hypothetical protein
MNAGRCYAVMKLFLKLAGPFNLEITDQFQGNDPLVSQAGECRPVRVTAPFSSTHVRDSKRHAFSLSPQPSVAQNLRINRCLLQGRAGEPEKLRPEAAMRVATLMAAAKGCVASDSSAVRENWRYPLFLLVSDYIQCFAIWKYEKPPLPEKHLMLAPALTTPK